jgi:hypothetical protein
VRDAAGMLQSRETLWEEMRPVYSGEWDVICEMSGLEQCH